MAKFEGFIIEGYLTYECLIFYSRYLDMIDTWFNLVRHFYNNLNHIEPRHGDSIFSKIGYLVEKMWTFVL